MKKRVRNILVLVLSLVFFLSSFLNSTHFVPAATEIKINLHYHRYIGDYEGWNVWSWINGSEGSAYEFNGEDEFGKVASYSISVSDKNEQIGFILRRSTDTNPWDKKDCNEDRFIDIKQEKDGVIDVYVLQDQNVFSYQPEGINLNPGVTKASFVHNRKIAFSVPSGFDSTRIDTLSKIHVFDNTKKEYQVESLSCEQGKNVTYAEILMKEELPLTGTYTLSFEGYGECAVTISSLFSTDEFEEAFYYWGDDLGATWTKQNTSFRVWAPTASKVTVNLYETGDGNDLIKSLEMTPDEKGTWFLTLSGDLNGVYYTYLVTANGETKEAVDPYVKAVGVNGERGMVIDLDTTNPDGFETEEKPPLASPTDSIIYELHIRDFSADDSSGIVHKGKYLAFTETGTTSKGGTKTGIDYLADLGITHVHLLPSFDFSSVDETRPDIPQYNWGYDPQNYNVPEGSYSTDPYHGEVRIKEFKQMVQALHQKGIRVIMDVVYNHTAESLNSNFNKIVPGYYYRMDALGGFSNASGCGNETASERAMVQKFIADSVVYWAKEYHIDGFRFDLMGIHDIETMNVVRGLLDTVDPSILVYGEGWTGGSSVLPDSERALKSNMSKLDPNIAAFSDTVRDGIKGSVFEKADQGFATGKTGMEETIKFGIVASTNHDQIDYSKVNYDKSSWATEPSQTITYASAHDNLTLWDKICTSNALESPEIRTRRNLLAGAIVLTSQGIPFFSGGEEFLRSKPLDDTGSLFDENSYKSPDSVNSLKWDTVADHLTVLNYYKGLIKFRKAHAALRMTSTTDIQKNLTFLDGLEENVVGYIIDNSTGSEVGSSICVLFNANNEAKNVNLPEGNWEVYIKGEQAGTDILETITNGEILVEPISAAVLVREEENENAQATGIDQTDPLNKESKDAMAKTENSEKKDNDKPEGNTILFSSITTAFLLGLFTAGITFFIKRHKQ